MEKEFLLWNLSLNDSFTTQLTAQVVSVALIVAVICLVISTGWNYLLSGFKALVSDDNSFRFPDYEQLGRGLIIILLISAYIPCCKVVVGSIDAINEATALNASASATYEKIMENFINYQDPAMDSTMVQSMQAEGDSPESILSDEYRQYEATGDGNKEETSFWSRISKTLDLIAMFISPSFAISMGVHTLFTLLFQLVKIVILGVAVIIVKVLVILGPLALAFSILPVFNKQMEIWFGTLVNTALVFTTVNILDSIVATAFVHIFNPNKSYTELIMMKSELLALDLILLIMYVSSFWLTSKIAGKADAGRVISKLVGAATAAAGLTMSGGTSIAASGGKAANTITAGKGLIENNTKEK